MDYLIRLVHVHETFRLPELYALAVVAGVDLKILSYNSNSPFCIVRLESEAVARALIRRSILSYGIYELWGTGNDYAALHASVRSNGNIDPDAYKTSSFRFTLDSFQGKRSQAEQRGLIESFSYLPFEGPIVMQGAQLQMYVFEDFDMHAPEPHMLYLGRFIASGDRDAMMKYDLKKRRYISRTSMESELSLVTANLTLAAPGKIMYDPFVGTGSFSVTCAHFGAMALGSDIDGRSVRGTSDRNILSNFAQYGVEYGFLDSLISDLTHSPLRQGQWLDGIICDPPYGVREGPKVLGYREGKEAVEVFIDGVTAHKREGFVPAKRPYGFHDMLQDVLDFAFAMLVDGARLSMWMPTANDEDVELAKPSHPGLELLSVCVQQFNKWSRQLLTYERLANVPVEKMLAYERQARATGRTADEVNSFRKKYFAGFKESQA